MMSLPMSVAELIEEHPGSTCDDLLPHLPGYERQQVIKAMHNARERGLIHCAGRLPRSGGPRNGSYPAPYYPGPAPHLAHKKPKLIVPKKAAIPRVASVWELANL